MVIKRLPYSRQSSYELLVQKEQYRIFIDLLEYIDYLREQEEMIFFDSSEIVNLNAYRATFGQTPVVMQLLHGVENSLNYSGIMKMPKVEAKFDRIKKRIDETCRKLQESI